jgi:predicted NAD/FAD-binding protein
MSMKIAIVGSGIAGLSAARILCDAGMQVEIFEMREHLGMDADSIDVGNMRVDAPPRTFNPGFYPNLCALYQRAGVVYERMCWSTAVFSRDSDGFGLIQRVLDKTFWADKSWVSMMMDCVSGWRIARDIIVFRASLEYYTWANTDLSSFCFRDFIKQGGYSPQFVDCLLLPVLSMVCTCTYEAVLQYPTDVLLCYFKQTLYKTAFRTKLGTQHAAMILAEGCRVHLGQPITKVVAGARCLEFEKDGEAVTRQFDKIIIATQANTAAKLLHGAPRAVDVLRAVKHEYSTGVMHTDSRAMPERRSEWAPMNMMLKEQSSMFTIWLNHQRKNKLYAGLGTERNIFQVRAWARNRMTLPLDKSAN